MMIDMDFFGCLSVSIVACSELIEPTSPSFIKFFVNILVWVYAHLSLVYLSYQLRLLWLGRKGAWILNRLSVFFPLCLVVMNISIPLILIVVGFYMDPSVLWSNYFYYYEYIPIFFGADLFKYYFDTQS